MPVVALPLLSLFIDVKSAAMLLSMPLIFSNLPRALEGGKTAQCLMQLIPVFLGMIPGLFLGVRVLLFESPLDQLSLPGKAKRKRGKHKPDGETGR